jgi:hypothetical protein
LNADTIRFIRSEGVGLLTDLNRELFLNFSGRKIETRITDIYGSRREFLEPELYLSYTEPASGDEEDRARHRLISSFLAGAFLGGKSSGPTDRILALEAGLQFRAGGRSLTIRSAKAALLSEPKKHKRDEIAIGNPEVLSGLNDLCRRKLGIMTECSESLGFGSYGELLDAVSGTGIARLVEEAKKFLADTDYIARDMLGWYFMKKMELPLKDASIYDMTYLFNSAELKGYFTKIDPALLSRTVLEGMALSPAHEPSSDTEKRAGKEPDGFSLPLDPPFETAISVYPSGGIHDYESFLRGLGHSLCFCFTDPGDDFEFAFLRDGALTDIFSGLFGGLVCEPRWMRKHLRIDTDGDFLDFVRLRRLMTARLDAGRALYAHELFGSGDPRDLPEIFSEIMSGAAQCEADGRSYIAEFLSPLSSPFRFKAALAGPGLRRFMMESFDEEWWRTKDAGVFMSGLWSRGGRITADSLLTTAGLKEPASETLVRNFEETLR